MILTLIAIPILMALLNLGRWNLGLRRIILTIGALLMLALSAALAVRVDHQGAVTAMNGSLRVDALSAILLLTVNGAAAAAFPYSGGYLEELSVRQAIAPREIRRFSILLPLFALMTTLVPLLNNLGLVWGAMEAATLAAVFLVAFYRTEEALEAAWKFLIITSIGSLIGLVGTLVFFSAAATIAGPETYAGWTALLSLAPRLSPGAITFGFTLVAIGYGTKAGVTPMHTWMPDAYSRAPSPVCALLSGSELSCAMYIIFRYVPIAERCVGHAFVFRLLGGLGLATLIVAALFVVAQREYKRLLAYSSMEHTALMLLGVAFGGPLGLFGAIWQLMTHAFIKSAMFFGAGNILLRYGTTDMEAVKGVLSRMPVTGTLWLICTAAIVGAPPFALFGSDLSIFGSAFTHGHRVIGALTVLLLAVIYIALFYWVVRMVYGEPAPMPEDGVASRDAGVWSVAPMLCLAVLALALGLVLPGGLRHLLEASASLMR